MKTKGKLLRAMAGGLAVVLLVPGAALGIEYGGIGGRPANPDPDVPRSDSIFIYTIKPGASKGSAIKVINNKNERKTLEIYAVDSVVASGGALSCEQKGDDKDEVGDWIELSRDEVTLGPVSNEDVPFTIKMPDKVSPGEHNGCLVVQEKNQTPEKKAGGIALTTRTGIRVAITVPGDIKRELAFTGYEVIRRQDRDGYILRTNIRNSGNVSIDADIKATTRYPFWLLKYDETGGEFAVLPFTEAEFNFELEKPFWGLLYRSKPSLTYDADPGKKVDKRKLTGSAVWFWVWPHPVAAAVEILLVFGLVFGTRRYRRYRGEEAEVAGWVKYRVKKGDTLQSIAKTRGTSVRLLAKANQVTRAYRPKARTSLKVPNPRIRARAGSGGLFDTTARAVRPGLAKVRSIRTKRKPVRKTLKRK